MDHHQEINNQTVASFLKERITDYTSRRSHHSLTTLSAKSGVPYNTVRRLAGSLVEKPNLETAFSILQITEDSESFVRALKKYYPDLEVILPKTSNYSEENQAENLSNLLEDPTSYSIFNLSKHWNGVDQKTILNTFGEDGLNRLEDLVSVGGIEVAKCAKLGISRYKSAIKVEKNIKRDLSAIDHKISFFNKELIGTDATFMATHTEALNSSGLKALKKLVNDLSIRVNKVKQDPQYQGNIPCHLDVIYGLLDPDRLNLDEEVDSGKQLPSDC